MFAHFVPKLLIHFLPSYSSLNSSILLQLFMYNNNVITIQKYVNITGDVIVEFHSLKAGHSGDAGIVVLY